MLYIKNLVYHPAASDNSILTQVNLELAPQQMGLIIGPSGSGKSTLLEILAGLATKTKGNIRWREQELTPEHLQQLVGLVFQFPERHFCGQLINLLGKLKKHWTLLVVTHDARELFSLADRCWSLKQGHLTSLDINEMARSETQKIAAFPPV